MKTFDVSGSEVTEGLEVDMTPYPKVVLGRGGNKRATWIAIGRRDQNQLIKQTPEGAVIFDASVIITKEKEQPLLVLPRDGGDERALILWRIPSGYRGSASISAPDGVKVVARDVSWHSGRGNLGETSEVLAILEPGQYLEAKRSGRHLQETRARLTWDGNGIEVVFYEDGSSPFQDEEEGELL